MTWNAFHRRGEVLDRVIETVDARLDGELPMDLPGVAETFSGEMDLISALQLKWHARLSGNIERVLMGQPMDVEDAVARAWSATRAELPGIRLVIDRYTDAPSDEYMKQALARAAEKEWLKLGAAAGLTWNESSQAVATGRRVEQLARTKAPAPLVEEPEPLAPMSLKERIRAVLTG